MTDTVPSVRKPRRSFLEQIKFNLSKAMETEIASRKKLAKAGFEGVDGLNVSGMWQLVDKAIADGTTVTAVRSNSIGAGDSVSVKEEFVGKYTVIDSALNLNNLEVVTVVPGRGGCIVVRCDATRFKVAANHVKRV
jgi:hypothetical protein